MNNLLVSKIGDFFLISGALTGSAETQGRVLVASGGLAGGDAPDDPRVGAASFFLIRNIASVTTTSESFSSRHRAHKSSPHQRLTEDGTHIVTHYIVLWPTTLTPP